MKLKCAKKDCQMTVEVTEIETHKIYCSVSCASKDGVYEFKFRKDGSVKKKS